MNAYFHQFYSILGTIKGDNKVKHEEVLDKTEERIHELTSLVIEITERNELYQARIDNMKEDEVYCFPW